MTQSNHKQSLKEILRHILFLTGSYRLLKTIKQLKGYQTTHLNLLDRREVFQSIYNSGVWVQDEDQESLSGIGSSLEVTQSIRAAIPKLIKDLRLNHLVDVGCGDWTWMSRVDIPCRYTGIDIVKSVVDSNTARFTSNYVNFLQLDAVSQPIPSCDAVLCREVIFHLNFADGAQLIKNFKKSARWLIMTSDTAIWFNSNIVTGDYRRLNLQCAPYRFPVPDLVIPDNDVVAGRILGVWRTESLP